MLENLKKWNNRVTSFAHDGYFISDNAVLNLRIRDEHIAGVQLFSILIYFAI